MADPLFSPKDIPDNVLNNFSINNYDEKVKIIRDWQDGIANGKILTQKEEQLQWSFLESFFGKVLEYPYGKHLTEYELENEQKTVFDATKPDGTLGYFELKDKETYTDIRAVVELKGATIDLDKKQNRKEFAGSPVEQAFSYVPKMGGKCNWVIVSNFKEIRLYHHSDITRYENFFIPDLLKNGNLKKFCFILQSGRLFVKTGESRIEAILAERQERQKNISVEFYGLYKVKREELYFHLRLRNPDTDPIELFYATQKLVDRVIFICFARDIQIIGDVFKRINTSIENTFSPSDDNLWPEIKHLFNALDKGLKGLPPFNGGLFRTDALIDSLHIGNTYLSDLIDFTKGYDFLSDIDVNILGHIFEQSISDIEEILYRIKNENALAMAETGLEDVPKPTTSKRKKDGIFYTPAYITRYIVEQSVGAWLDDRSHEILQKMGMETMPVMEAEDFEGVGRDDKKKSGYTDKINTCLHYWQEYENALHGIKVLDPACGSGAFLVQAFDYLYAQHKIIERERDTLNSLLKALENQDVKKKRPKDILLDGVFGNGDEEWKVKKRIIEENIYGVDINSASVEITKLSLWLKTANSHIKLAGLDENIQHGNSLVDDPEVAGELAFDWQTRFKKIMDAGGFDVVVGNPPYVRADSEGNSEIFRKHLTSSGSYSTLSGKWDLYIPFIELSLKVLKVNGRSSLIIPDAYCHANYAQSSLEWLMKHNYLHRIDYFPGIEVFKGVGVKSVIINNSKKNNPKYFQRIHISESEFTEMEDTLYPSSFRLDSKDSIIATKAIKTNRLDEICYISKGIVGNSDEKEHQGEFLVEDLLSQSKDSKHPKKYFEGKDISKWHLHDLRWIEYNTKRSPSLWSRKGFTEFFEGGEKLVAMRSPGVEPRTLLDYENAYFNESAIGFKKWNDLINVENKSLKKAYNSEEERKGLEKISSAYDYKYILSILNSSLIKYELNTNRRSNIHIYPEDWKDILIPAISKKAQQPFVTKAEIMLAGNKQLQELSGKFLEMLGADMKIDKFSQKLNHWYELDWAGFKTEIQKAKPKISLTGKAEENWLERFQRLQAEALQITQTLHDTDKEIDKMVYALYGLTEEEMRIVEGDN